jgi:RNA polymerase sigma-70 factor (ECF subfamily)
LQDKELVERFVQRGDEEAFRQLFRRHSPRLYALARRLTGGDDADAEDIVQDTWLRASRQLGRFEWRSALTTWLSAIVINCARERMRTTSRLECPADLEDPPAPVRSPVAGIDLERAIARLADGYRHVLVLHDIEGLTHFEIADALGIAVGTSKSQLSRARALVRADLKGRET